MSLLSLPSIIFECSSPTRISLPIEPVRFSIPLKVSPSASPVELPGVDRSTVRPLPSTSISKVWYEAVSEPVSSPGSEDSR